MLWYMGKRINPTFDQSQIDGFQQMKEEGEADNLSEAARRASAVGLRQMGYENGEKSDTTLKAVVKQVSWLFTVAGLVGLGFTFAYPVPARIPSFAVTTLGVGLFGIYRVLEAHEPKVSKRLKRLVGREAA